MRRLPAARISALPRKSSGCIRSTDPTLSVVGTAHAAAEPHQMLDEIEADLTVIEATVDMGGLGVDEALGADGFGEAQEQAHGEAGSLAAGAFQKFAIERREGEHHRRGRIRTRPRRGSAPPSARRRRCRARW